MARYTSVCAIGQELKPERNMTKYELGVWEWVSVEGKGMELQCYKITLLNINGLTDVE